RGSSRDEYAVYTEDAGAYLRFVDRLARKWETAKELVPGPVFYRRGDTPGPMSAKHEQNVGGRGAHRGKSVPAPFCLIFFGTSTDAALEALDLLAAEGISLDAMRPRAFPFGKAFCEFIDAHDKIFVIEQNRDAQFRSMMMIELGVDPAKLVSILN